MILDLDYNWHIWVINHSKLFYIESFIDRHVREVEEILCPSFTKEYLSKRGVVKSKKTPFYTNYAFIKYKYDPKVVYKLKKCPFIMTNLGNCSREDIRRVKEVDGTVRKINDINVEIGEEVLVSKGPLKGFGGRVIGVHGKNITLEIEILGREVSTEVSLLDIGTCEEILKGDCCELPA